LALADVLAAPLAPVTTTVPVPASAVVAAVIVAIASAPGLTLAGLRVTLTPVGAVALSVTALVKPVVAPTATEKVVVFPGATTKEAGANVTVSVGATTVTPTLAVAVAEPLAPFTEIVPLPAAAVVEAETVAVALEPGLTLAGLKLTVTLVGAVADNVIAFVYPLVAPTATVNVVRCP
jgi:hypothetical protein